MPCFKRCCYYTKKIIDLNYCTYSLSKLIRENFEIDDIIGLTFIENGVASIATGRYKGIYGCAIKVSGLLIDDIISYVPLNDVSSVEKGITEISSKPLSIKLKK